MEQTKQRTEYKEPVCKPRGYPQGKGTFSAHTSFCIWPTNTGRNKAETFCKANTFRGRTTGTNTRQAWGPKYQSLGYSFAYPISGVAKKAR